MLKITKRNLPHWVLPDSVYFVTFNLITGKLNDDEILLVRNHLIDGDHKFCDLYASVVMNTHAHMILRPFDNYILSRIMKGYNSFYGVHKNLMATQMFVLLSQIQKAMKHRQECLCY